MQTLDDNYDKKDIDPRKNKNNDALNDAAKADEHATRELREKRNNDPSPKKKMPVPESKKGKGDDNFVKELKEEFRRKDEGHYPENDWPEIQKTINANINPKKELSTAEKVKKDTYEYLDKVSSGLLGSIGYLGIPYILDKLGIMSKSKAEKMIREGVLKGIEKGSQSAVKEIAKALGGGSATDPSKFKLPRD